MATPHSFSARSAVVSAAADGAIVAKFRNGGRACTAANILFVHDSLAIGFLDQFGRKEERLSVGPAADGREIGPLLVEHATTSPLSLVTRLMPEPVTHLAEHSSAGHYFYPPTVLTDVPNGARIVRATASGRSLPSSRGVALTN